MSDEKRNRLTNQDRAKVKAWLVLNPYTLSSRRGQTKEFVRLAGKATSDLGFAVTPHNIDRAQREVWES